MYFIDAFSKLAFEAEFQTMSPGGAISYVEVPNMQNNIPAVLSILRFIYDNIMYAELNTKSDYCQVCGYDGEIRIVEEDGKLLWECPNCGNRDEKRMNVCRRVCGYRDGVELACIFSDIDASVYIKKEDYLSATGVDAHGLLMNTSGKRIKAVTGDLGNRFGRGFYEEWNRDGHMTEEQWQTRIEARLCEAGERLRITSYSELESFIRQELGELFEEVKP